MNDVRSNAVARVALISSPRSGNLWVRSVVARALDLQEFPVFNYKDMPREIPQRCMLQTHWYREPNFQTWLSEHGFAKLCIARHPLDILVSVLHFIRYEPRTARWLEGNVEIPERLSNATPASGEFLEYALSFGAENLLSVSYQWWHDQSIHRLRYEDCVRDPVRALGGLVQALGGSSESVQPFVKQFSIDGSFKPLNRHVWQGRPGLYKKLIPPLHALRIYRRHKRIFDVLGYGVEPYLLSKRRAVDLWSELA